MFPVRLSPANTHAHSDNFELRQAGGNGLFLVLDENGEFLQSNFEAMAGAFNKVRVGGDQG